MVFFFSSKRRHTSCALVTGVQTCALPISHCNARDWRAAMTPRAAILLESREQLARWVERYDLQCEFAELGLDYVFHDQRELDHLAAELQPLAEVGVAGEVIDGPAYLRDEQIGRAHV